MSPLVDSYSAALIVIVGGIVAFAVAQLLARMVAVSDFLLDRPNERSSHAAVTPRSGGIAILGAWIAALGVIAIFADWLGFTKDAVTLAPLVGAAFLFGLADDRFNLNASLKIFAQIALAMFYVALFGPLDSAPLPFMGETPLGAFAAPITVFWIVGFMNAYNFMDGVNGIAAACGALALAALAAAAALSGSGFWAIATGIAAVSLLSFLPMNFPKARVFMGDNGSQAIGFLFAAATVAIANGSEGAISALFGPLLMLPFLFDVAVTLVVRARRRRNILSAHREHLYQLLARLGLSHGGVTAVFLSFTALSVAVAIVNTRVPAAYQFAAPLALIAAFAGPALRLLRRADDAGFLERRVERDIFANDGQDAAGAPPQPFPATPAGVQVQAAE